MYKKHENFDDSYDYDRDDPPFKPVHRYREGKASCNAGYNFVEDELLDEIDQRRNIEVEGPGGAWGTRPSERSS